MKHFFSFVLLLLMKAGLLAQGHETFNNMPIANPATSYGLRQWTGDGNISWTATDARTDLTINGRAILIRNGALTSGTIPNGIGNLSFKHQQEFSGSNPVLQVFVNGNLIGSVNPTITEATASLNNINVGGDFILEIRQITNGLRIKIDDVIWTGFAASPCVVPSAQATNLLFSGVGPFSAQANFTAAAPPADKYLVLYGTAASPSQNPSNGTAYSAGQILGNMRVAGYSANTSVTLTPLLPGTQFFVFVYAANDNCSGGPVFQITSPLTQSFSTPSLPDCTIPENGTGLTVIPSGTFAAVGFTAPVPAPGGYMLVLGTNPLDGTIPVNGTSYAVGTAFGNGTVAYSGETAGTLLTGLTISTNYYLRIFAFNNTACANGPKYSTTSLSGNFTTLAGGGNIPAGYYDTINGKSCAPLKSALAWRLNHDLSKNLLVPKTYTELWNQFLLSDVKPREVGPGTSPLVIWDMYSDNPSGIDPYNFTPGPVSLGGQQDNGFNAPNEGILYNREHSVPQNWFNGNTSIPGPATDYNHIFPTDKWVNALRDSYIFGEVANPVTTTLNGSKLGPNAFSGLTGTAFEPIDSFKGDFARAFLYFVSRYEEQMPSFSGGIHGGQAFAQNTYPSVEIPYLRLMVKWHKQDPVSMKEKDRNDAAFTYQGNRNPFIDLPELVDLVWNDDCGILLPFDLLFFKGTQRGNIVKLEWRMAPQNNDLLFEVQRSFDGRNFKTVGSLSYYANRNDYFWDDLVEKAGAGRVYYRIKLKYAHKPEELSDVYSIHLQGGARFTVFPDPASNRVWVDFGAGVFTGKLLLVNMVGVTFAEMNVKQASGRVPLVSNKLVPGHYKLVLLEDGKDGKPNTYSFSVLR
jgi:endonuclease I